MAPREPEEPAGRAIGTGYKYVSMGITFAGGIVMFTGLGWLADRWLGTLPLFLIVGAVVGSVLSFVWVYLKLRQDEETYEREHPSRRGPGPGSEG
jgi:F0F1-type ATP synthase assembly protein I